MCRWSCSNLPNGTSTQSRTTSSGPGATKLRVMFQDVLYAARCDIVRFLRGVLVRVRWLGLE